MGRKYAKSLGNPAIAVAYLRVSTEEQHLGPVTQRSQIEMWAESRKVKVVTWHVDQGVSGGAVISDRPALFAAINDLRKQGAGWLVISKRDRLARDLEVVLAIEKAVTGAGAGIACADGTTELEGAAGTFMRRTFDNFAEYERGVIRERTKAALAAKKGRGERVGNVPYGFHLAPDGVRLEEDQREQGVIARARELRDRKVTLRGIASMLDLEGFKTRVGTAFTHVQVSKMLGRPPIPKPKAAEPPRPPQPLSESFQSWRGGR